MSFLNGLAGIFKDSALSALGAGFQAMQDPQSFLKDDLPADSNRVAKWIQSRNRRACRLHARNEAAGLYSGLGALRRPRYERVCGPYLDSIGEGPTSEGSYAPPFTGGQCVGKAYVIQYRSRAYNSSGNLISESFFNQGYPSTFSWTYGPLGWQNRCISQFGRNDLQVGFTSKTSNGSYADGPSTLYPNGCALGGRIEIDNVNIIAGTVGGGTFVPGVDNCGNLPNEYKPPKYPTNLPPIGPPDTSTPPPGGDGSDDVTVDPDGNIRICENGECSDPFPPGGGGNPSEDPGEEDGDPKENDPDDPNDDTIEGCVEEGRILTGLQINFTRIPLAVSGPLDYYRNVCFVGFGPDLNLIDLVVDGKLIKDGQFVIPDSEFCRCYRVVVSPGWGLSVQAYSRPEKTE